MKGIVRYYASIWGRKLLPEGIYRRIMTVRQRYKAWSHARIKEQNRARFGLCNAKLLREQLLANGVRPGGVLLVQSSFDRFYTFTGTASDVVEVLDDVVGVEGTLVMPAHPQYRSGHSRTFDVRRTPSGTGILCELFRRHPEVVRSLHPTHSVCARGPLADRLIADHHCDPLSCGPLSPYARIVEHKGQILGLGLPPAYTTFLHVVEDVGPFPCKMYRSPPVDFSVTDQTGQMRSVPALLRDDRVMARLNLDRIVVRLSPDALRTFSVVGIPCFLAESSRLLAELQALSVQGICHYS